MLSATATMHPSPHRAHKHHGGKRVARCARNARLGPSHRLAAARGIKVKHAAAENAEITPSNLTQVSQHVVANASCQTETEEWWPASDEEESKEESQILGAEREMFAKLPKSSYSQSNRAKPGLLTQLLNPDPSIFPPHHPYRTSVSGQAKEPRTIAQSILHTNKSTAIPLAAAVTAHAKVV